MMFCVGCVSLVYSYEHFSRFGGPAKPTAHHNCLADGHAVVEGNGGGRAHAPHPTPDLKANQVCWKLQCEDSEQLDNYVM